FRLELEPNAVALDRSVAALQSRQADAAVLLEVAAVTDAYAGQVEELRGGGQHRALVRSREGEVFLDTAPHAAEHAREVGEMRVLRVLAPLAPLGMIEVLLAALLVAAGR